MEPVPQKIPPGRKRLTTPTTKLILKNEKQMERESTSWDLFMQVHTGEPTGIRTASVQ